MRQPAGADAVPRPAAGLARRDRPTRKRRARPWKGTILVADDDRTIRTVLAQALTRAGCRVRATGTATTLWRWIEEGEGDVVVTDVMMPDGDALDLLPAIRKRRPELPVIVMSAQNTVMTAIRAAEVGAYEYLPKPFDLKEVLGQVAKALKPPDPRRARAEDEPAQRARTTCRSSAARRRCRRSTASSRG